MTSSSTTAGQLAQRAGTWLSRIAEPPPRPATEAVVTDRFDTMAWNDIHAQSKALRHLIDDLGFEFDHAAKLIGDVFQSAYQFDPKLREQGEMARTARINHRAVRSLLDSAPFSELRDHTVDDDIASAFGVLAQKDQLRTLLTAAKDAQEQAQAAEQADEQAKQAAQAVADAIAAARAAAGGDDDGQVPGDLVDAAMAAIAAAEEADATADEAGAAADAALNEITPTIDDLAQAAAATAANEAEEQHELVRSWGVNPGELKRMNFDERATLAARMRNNRMKNFTRLIGRFRRMAAAERSRKVDDVHGELIGLTLGDELRRVAPSELVKLALPATRAIFLARFATRQLTLHDTRGTDRQGQGAIIACIDGSGSMERPGPQGITNEAWAKAIALALLDQARAAKRDFVGIHFGSAKEIAEFHFPAKERVPYTRVLDFASHYFDGGTDFQRPLTVASDLLEAEFNASGRQKADIVFITDGDCKVKPGWLEAWHQTKRRLAFRVFGIGLGSHSNTGPDSVLASLCDNVRSIEDLRDPATTKDMFRAI